METMEKESLKKFYSLARNRTDWEGTVVLFAVNLNMFYRIAFGSGCNLSQEDLDSGCDDYLDIYGFEWDGETPLTQIFDILREDDLCLDEVEGLEERDGGEMMLKRKDWENGDIRRFLLDALEFANYGSEQKKNWGNDLILVSQHD